MAKSMATGGTSGSSTGGSISIPEAVTVSQVGAATFSYPIAVPPGRNGLQPNIALKYSSYNGNGWIGVGWDLDFGSIKRSTKNGLDYSASDFIAGGSELVSNSSWGTGYYCAKIEGAFTKYYFDTSSNYWIAYAKDGTKYYYGQSPASQMTNSHGTYSWHLNRVEDTNGNYMTITYTKISNQIYPYQISYTGNTGLSPNKTIEFELEDRDDDIRSYKTKALVTTSKRLKAITVKVGTTTVYKYSLSYEYSPGNGRSRLVAITRVDPGDQENTLPPTEFFWTDGGDGTFGSPSTMALAGGTTGGKIAFGDIDGDGREEFIKYCFSDFPFVVAYPYLANDSGGFSPQSPMYLGMWFDADSMSVALGDINGDGLADIVFNSGNGYVYTYLSNGDGTFSNGGSTPCPDGAITSIYLAELNGDGLADLVGFNSSDLVVWTELSNGDGTFDAGSYYAKAFNTIDGTIHLGDVNGDGISDLCIFNTLVMPNYVLTMSIYLGDGSGAFDTYYWSLLLSPIATKTCELADVNGDGLADLLVNTSNTSMSVYISTGTGMTGPYTTTINGQTYVADVNDDGMADVIMNVASFGTKCFFQSKGDGTFYSPIYTGGTPGTNYYQADIDGNGRPDMIGYHDSYIVYAFSNGGDAGDHIETITTPLGGTTTLTYGNNTNIADNKVPLTLHPVLDVETDDGYNVSLTSYDYSGSYYDYAERDFRGFSTVTQTRPDGTTVKTTYEQIDDYKKGVPLSIEMTAPGESSPFMETTYSWGTYTIPNTTAKFVKLNNKRVDTYGNTDVYTNEAYTYSNTHGGVLTTVTSGSGSAENVTLTNSYINKGSWLWIKASESISGSTSGLVRQTNYTYNSLGNLLTKTYVNTTGSNPVETYTYDSYGNIATYQDPKNNITSYYYDNSKTHVTGIHYPTTGYFTHSVSMQYNILGKLDQDTDENNNTTYYDYDEFGRLKEVNYPDGGQTKYEYYLTANPAYIKTRVLEEGSSYVDTWQYVDGFGRAIMNVSKGESGGNSDDVVTRQYYDEMGRSWKTEGPYFTNTYGFSHTKPSVYPASEKTFDYMGRILTVKTPRYQGSQSLFDTAYLDYDGFETTITDANGNIRTEIKDYLGRIIEVHEDPADGGVTFYDYNAAGDLVAVEDDQGNITSISYNTLGQKMSMDDPDMGYWSYTYDLNGNLYTQTDAKNQTITFLYDELNRIEEKSYSTSDPTVYYYYDNITIANGIGRLGYVTNGNATTIYNEYDEMGRVKSVTKNITGDTNRTTHFTYDLSGKAVRTTYPDGFWAQNNYYNGTNLLNSVTGSDGEEYAEITGYTPSGKIKTLYHDNGSSTTYTYDSRTEKLYQILTKNGSNATIQQRRYGYTSIGEINSINDLHNGKTFTYTYDSLSRLKTEVINGSTPSMSVSYDSLGNITSKTINGNSFIYAYDGNQAHAVSSITYGTQRNFTYDNNGNMTYGWDFTNPSSPKSRQIYYNADNMPVSITYNGSVNSTFLYDGMGTRVKKSVGSTDTYYIGDHFEVKGGTTTKYIFAGNLRVAQIKGSTRSYFHKDHLGSSTVMTSNSGVELESTNYMPFGSQRDHSGTDTSDYRFTDQELDSENGLYNYGARLYDPFIGRFISPDSIVPQQYNPQSLNRYSYCLNNPLIYNDPSGHEEMTYEEWQAYLSMGEYINSMYEVWPQMGGILAHEMGFMDPVTPVVDYWNLGFEEYNAHQLWKEAADEASKAAAGNNGESCTGKDAIIANPLLDPIEIGVAIITAGGTTAGKTTVKGIWNGIKSLFTRDAATSLRPIVRSLGSAGDDLLLKKAVNSNLPHAIERGVERGVFKTAQEANSVLRGLTVEISKTGTFPTGTLVDTARAGRFLVPVGDNGMAVYQLAKNGTAKLKTVLTAR